MATAAEVRKVLNQNQDKRKTPEYAELYAEYQQLKAQENPVYAPNKPDTDFFDQVEETLKGIPTGIIGLAEIGAIGAATLLNEEAELKVRGGIQSVAETLKSPFTADVGSEDLVGRKYGEALGSFVGLGLASVIPGVGKPLAAGLAMGSGAGEASERARAAGATEGERNVAAFKGIGVGLTELIPLAKLKSLKDVLGENAFLNGIERIKRAAVAGGFEGAQEAAAGVLQNAIQRGYDPTQDLLNVEVAEAGGYGASVGATVQALLDVAVPRKKGSATAPELSESDRAIEQSLYDDDVQAGVPPTTTTGPTPPNISENEESELTLSPPPDSLPVPRGRGEQAEAPIPNNVPPVPSQEEIAAIEKEVIRKAVNGEQLSASEAQIASRLDIRAEIDEQKTQEKVVEEVVEGEEGEKVTVPTGSTLPNLDEFTTEYQELVIRDPQDGENYLVAKLNNQEISDADADVIRNAEERIGKLPPVPSQKQIDIDNAKREEKAAQEKVTGTEEREQKVIDRVVNLYKKDIEENKNLSSTATNKKIDAALTGFILDPNSSIQPINEEESISLDRVTAVKETILKELKLLSTPTVATPPKSKKALRKGVRERREALAKKKEVVEEAAPNFFTRFKDVPDYALLRDTAAVESIKAVKGTVTKNKKRLGAGYNKAATYFNKFDRIEDAVEAIAFDYADKEVGEGKASKENLADPMTPEAAAFMKGMGGANAEAAYNWVQDSTMSEEVKEVARNTFEVYKTEIVKIKSQDTEAAKVLKDKKQKLKTDYVAGNAPIGDIVAEFTEEEVNTLKEQRERFKVKKAAEEETRKKKDEVLTASAVTNIEVPTPVVTSETQAVISEFEREVTEQVAREESYLSDVDKNQLKKLGAEIQELKVQQDKVGELDPKTLAKLKGKETKVRKIRKKAFDVATKTDRLQQEAKDIVYSERAKRSDLDTLYKDLLPNELYGFSLPLPSEALSELAQSISPTTNEALASNDLEGALNSISVDSADKRIQNLAKKFAPLASGTKVEVVKGLKDPRDSTPLAGLFDPRTNTVQLDSVNGLNTHAVLHEVSHALGSAELAKKGSAFAKKLTSLHKSIKDSLGNAYGAKSPDEFFSEAMGNEQFRVELARINPNGNPKSALTLFIDAVRTFLNSKLGLKFAGQSSSILSEVDALVDSIISPAPMSRNAETLAMNSDVRGVGRVMESLGNTWRSMNGPPTAANNRDFTDGSLQFVEDSTRAVGQTVYGAIDLPGIAELAKKYFGDIGTKLHTAANIQRGDMQAADNRADVVGNMLIRFREKFKESKYARFSDLIYSEEYGATINQIDPFFNEREARLEYDAEKFGEWQELKKNWDALSKETKGESERVYKVLRNFYRQQYKELKDTLYNRVKDVASPEELQTLNAQVFDVLFSDKVLDVYFPLARKGRYKLEYTIDINPDKPAGSGYRMEMYNTKSQAKRRAAELEEQNEGKLSAGGGVVIIDTREESTSGSRSTPIATIEAILRKTDQKLGENNQLSNEEKAIRAEVRSKIVEVFVDSLPETSFAKSLGTRKNTPGYEGDPLFALQTKGYDLGRQIVRIQSTKKVNDLESKLIEAYKIKRGTLDKSGSMLYQELMLRASYIRSPPADLFWQTIKQGAFVYTIGFNASSAIVNLSQIPLFTLPYLAGEYQSTSDATLAITKASGIVGSSFSQYDVGINKYYDVSADGTYSLNTKKLKERTEGMSDKDAKREEQEFRNLATLVKRASEEGQLTKSFIMDELSLQREAFKSGKDRTGNVFRQTLDKITGISAIGFNVAERFNRQTTMVATYNLELARISKGKDGFNFTEEQLNEAADKAFYVTQETNGGAFREVGPRISQSGWLSVALMYKSYGFRMYQTMIKSAITAARGTTFSPDPKENARLRKVAIHQLIGWHLSSLFFAGVYGIPLYGAVSMAINLFLDDEEDDVDNIVRKYIGELAYKGVVNEVTNVDIASRVRLTGLLIQSNKYNSNASAEETIGFYMGGPAISTAKRFGRGVESLLEGDIEKGIESMLPAGIANFYKASPIGRVYRDGFETKRGDPIYDDVTSGELAGQLFGFAPLEYTRRIEENMNAKNVEGAIKRKKSKILKRLYVSMRSNNSSDRVAALADMRKFNKRHPRYAILPETVERSMKAHQRTSATMHNGVVLSPAAKAELAYYKGGG